MSVDAGIHVTHLRVRRGGKLVLPDVSVQIPRGAVTGLLGPSGCGKTTFLRSIVGVQIVDGGDVEVLGLPAGSPALRSRVGYMTQAPSVYGDLSVEENLLYFARLLDAPPARVEETLGEVGLTDHAEQVVRALSGGERARASLATALLGQPEMLVLDEPTVGLDPVLRADLWAMFHRLAADGATLLVSSHVMDEAANCDRLLLMRDGRLVADDTPAAILQDTGAQDLTEAFLRIVA